MAGPEPVTGPIRFREALVIAFAIVGIGGVIAYVWKRDRDRERQQVAEFYRSASALATPPGVPAAALESLGTERLRAQATLAVASDDHTRAEAVLAELLRREPLDLAARYQLAAALDAQGAHERARAHLVLLANLDPETCADAARYREQARAALDGK